MTNKMERSSSEWGIAVWGERMCEKRKERINKRTKKEYKHIHTKKESGVEVEVERKYIYMKTKAKK